MAEEISEEVPDVVLYGLEQTRVEDGRANYTVFAEKASSYGEKKELLLENVIFREYDREGKTVTEGSVRRLLLFNETEDAELQGAVDFYSSREEAALRGDHFMWDNTNKILTAPGDTEVELIREDGSTVKGSGFEADFSSLTVRFSRRVSGKFVDEEEDDLEEETEEETR